MMILTRFFCLYLLLIGCTNKSDVASGEREVFSVIAGALKRDAAKGKFVDARVLVTREKIDAAGIPLLFIELESGQNGTSIKYPGENTGDVWLGIDGGTITLKSGMLLATRGMGDDLMASVGNLPNLSQIAGELTYDKKQIWLSEDNKISKLNFTCKINGAAKPTEIDVFDKKFNVRRVEEQCQANNVDLLNLYFIDDRGIVRRSKQYHSKTLGYILIERLD
jgi:hypothetical protein